MAWCNKIASGAVPGKESRRFGRGCCGIMGNVLECESSGGVDDADVIEDDLKWLGVSKSVMVACCVAVI